MNVYYLNGYPVTDELYHHGIQGQKWGVRRYQNEDGTLTDEGMRRYNKASHLQRDLNRLDKEIAYSKGDLMKLGNKATRLERKHNKYMKKNPNDEKGKEKEYVQKMADYTKQVKSIGSHMDVVNKMKEGLQWAAIGRGMNVSTKSITRDSVRPGERFIKEFGAVAMATSMVFVSPIGFGIGYGGPFTEPVSGTKYKVRNNQQNQVLRNEPFEYVGNNNGTVTLRPRK